MDNAIAGHIGVFRVAAGASVPVSAAVSGVVELDEPYGDGQLSDRELLGHAMDELLEAQTSGVRVLGSFQRTGRVRDRLSERRERRAAARLLRQRRAWLGGAA